MGNEVTILVTGKDQATPVFNRVRQSATGLRSEFTGLGMGSLAVAGGMSAVAVGANAAARSIYGLAGQASSVSEAQNKVNVVFGESSRVVSEFALKSSSAFGISRREALAAAGAYGNMFNTIGLGKAEAADMSVRLTQLASDMASFNDADPSDMLLRLRSGLAGEAEPLRQYGVLLSEARVKSEAYATGLASVGSELTEQQKVQARYNLILKDTTVQQGDFERTSTGLANAERKLGAEWETLTAKIGSGVEGPMAAAVGATSDLLGNIGKLAEAASKPIEFTVTVNEKGERSAGLSPMGIVGAGLGFAGDAAGVGLRLLDPLGVQRAKRAIGPWVGLAGDVASLGMDEANRLLFEAGLAGLRTPVNPLASEGDTALPSVETSFDWAGFNKWAMQNGVAGLNQLGPAPVDLSLPPGSSGGGGGTTRGAFSGANLARIAGFLERAPASPQAGDVAAFDAAVLRFREVRRELSGELAEVGLSMADLSARGRENTDDFRELEQQADSLRDASARLDLTETLRLDSIRDTIEATREQMAAEREHAAQMRSIANDLFSQLNRGGNLSAASSRGAFLAAAAAARGLEGSTDAAGNFITTDGGKFDGTTLQKLGPAAGIVINNYGSQPLVFPGVQAESAAIAAAGATE
ncbi:MAG: hypothetical protein AB7G21_09135 [Dehalococcoidia bacterium]